VRADIASTINYLFSLYAGGHADEAKIRSALYSACFEVVSAMHPELTKDEIGKKCEILADEFIKAFKLESVSKRMMSAFRGVLRP
jgi:hypothetical protein